MRHSVISRMMRGASPEQMIRRRDMAGGEMKELARIMNDPKPDPAEVVSYVRDLLKKGHIPPAEAAAWLASIPHDPAALRAWALKAFKTVMHQGIHGHAAFPRALYPASPQQAASPPGPAQGAPAVVPAAPVQGTPTIQ